MSYHNIQSAIAHWIHKETGFMPKKERTTAAVYWSLYGQGRSCTIEGRLADVKPLVAHMAGEGELESASRFATLLEAENGWIVAKPDNRSTCCKVESGGQFLEDGDWDVLETAREAADDLLESVLGQAVDLLEDYFLLLVCQNDLIRAYSTRHYRVEVKRIESDEVLDYNIEGLEPEEALEEMRQVTKRHGEYEAGDFQIRVLYRKCLRDDWDEALELVDKTYGGCVWKTADGPDYRDLVRECIEEARQTIHSLNFAHKEAA